MRLLVLLHRAAPCRARAEPRSVRHPRSRVCTRETAREAAAHLWLAAAVCGNLRWRGRAVTMRVAQLPNFSAYIQMSFLPSKPSSFLDRPTSFGSAVPLKLRSNPPTSPNLRNPRTSQTSPSGRTTSSSCMQSCRWTTPRPHSSERCPTRRRPTSSRVHAMTKQKRF